MSTAGDTIRSLLTAEPLRGSLIRSVVHSLGLPPGSRGLDAGCGIGLHARSLSDAAGPHGRIVGLDILPELLEYGKVNIDQSIYADCISFCQGNANSLPFADDSFDWAWSADCIGYPGGELAHVLHDLKRIIRPGGRIVILAWSSQQLLPGHSLLEARLNATCSSYYPYLSGLDPEFHFLRLLRWFQEAGLEDVYATTFVGDVSAPLSSGERLALLDLFRMLWGTPQPGVRSEDWQEYQRLCSPGSPGLILDLPGYYAFFTYTVFQGKVRAR